MTRTDRHLVSVIIPVYNRTDLLREAVASGLAQSFRPVEIIIVDDGSTDKAAIEAIRDLVSENPDIVQSVQTANSGPGSARQAGMEVARGEFVQFLDSDDLLLPRKFELQVTGLNACPECALSYGKTREYVIGEEPENVPSRCTGQRYGTIFPATLKGRLWATETPLFRRSALDQIGCWSSLRVLEDWEYECRLGARGAKLHFCDEFVSDHRHHDGAREGLRWQQNLAVFNDLLSAHVKVLGYAQDAGIATDSPEIKHYARSLFRLARIAGARGLPDEAVELLHAASEIDPAHHREYRLYRWSAAVIGWKRLAGLSEFLAGLRKHTQESGAEDGIFDR